MHLYRTLSTWSNANPQHPYDKGVEKRKTCPTQFNGFATVENPNQTVGYNPNSPDVFRPIKTAPLVDIKGGQRLLCCRGLIEPSLMIPSEKLSRTQSGGFSPETFTKWLTLDHVCCSTCRWPGSPVDMPIAAVIFMSEDILFAAYKLGIINGSPSPHCSTSFKRTCANA